jgi:hypothetical protein
VPPFVFVAVAFHRAFSTKSREREDGVMRKFLISFILGLAVCVSAPAFAAPIPAGGITMDQMAKLMTARGWSAKITEDAKGNQIIKSRAADVNFDVYFYNCANDRCRDIQFAAGWSKVTTAPSRINQWNTEKRFLRVYWKEGNVLWAELDSRVARSTTENINRWRCGKACSASSKNSWVASAGARRRHAAAS